MSYVFEPVIPSMAVAGREDRFPLHRIYCVGRNYADHAREMGSDPDREPPFFFMKPADAVVANGSTIPYPPATGNLHHEIELVVAIGKGGSDIKASQAEDHVWGYAVGIDLTRRDLQNEAKKTGRPWDMGKGFDRSAPCTALHPASQVGHPAAGAIWLTVDGETRQSGDLNQLIWSVPETIEHLSALVELAPGDLIMTGTPEGVGPVEPGQSMVGHVDGLEELTVTIR